MVSSALVPPRTPAGCGAAFIFVQQTAADHKRRLADALATRATLPVMQAHDGLVPKHGHIYVIPPNVVPTLTHGAVRVTPAANSIDCPADILFASLAQGLGDKTIGVILSGGGSDLAPGIRAIRQAGGTTFAQYPGCARFPNLPISAIDTGCVDFVLRPNEIAHELTRISERRENASRGDLRPHTNRPEAHAISLAEGVSGVCNRKLGRGRSIDIRSRQSP